MGIFSFHQIGEGGGGGAGGSHNIITIGSFADGLEHCYVHSFGIMDLTAKCLVNTGIDSQACYCTYLIESHKLIASFSPIDNGSESVHEKGHTTSWGDVTFPYAGAT